MQVVYSGGSTPKPSPRIPRKTGYGRPIMPGYMTHVHPQVLTQRSRENLTEGDVTLRDSIPAMSKCVASVCLVFNIFIPGAGTLIAGLSVLCCSHVRPKDDSKIHCICVNAGVALVQFVLTFLFLLGWIWSIMWGIAFLSVSSNFKFDLCTYRLWGVGVTNAIRNLAYRIQNTAAADLEENCLELIYIQLYKYRSFKKQWQTTERKLARESQTAKELLELTATSCKEQYYYRNHDEKDSQEYNGVNRTCSEINNTSTRNLDRSTPKNYNHRLDSDPPEKKSHHSERIHRCSSRASSLESQSSEQNEHVLATGLAKSKGDDKQRTTLDQAACSRCVDVYQVRPNTIPPQPIIALQQSSVSSLFDDSAKVTPTSSGETIMKARTRHMKMMQRKMGNNELSPFALTHKQLEDIIKHDIPVIAPDNRQSGEHEVPRDGLPKC